MPVFMRGSTSAYLLMKQRTLRGDHPFGTIKPWNAQDYCLMQGLEKGRAAMRLSAVAYTLKRVIHILRIPTLLAPIA